MGTCDGASASEQLPSVCLFCLPLAVLGGSIISKSGSPGCGGNSALGGTAQLYVGAALVGRVKLCKLTLHDCGLWA